MTERREDYPKILDAIESIRTDIAKVVTQVEERNNSALQWRSDVCKKFDKVFTWLEQLPCKERAGLYESVKNVLICVWGAIGIVFTILAVHIGWK